MAVAQDDKALLAKAGSGRSLSGNEQHRLNELAKGHTQTGSNIRAWQDGNRKSPT